MEANLWTWGEAAPCERHGALTRRKLDGRPVCVRCVAELELESPRMAELERTPESRDVRLTDAQLAACEYALRDEIKKRSRSIARAEESRRAGGRVQHGVLDEHYSMRDAAREALEAFTVARRAIRRREEG